MEKKPKVVLDTNLFISTFFNKGSFSFDILEMAREKNIQALWTEQMKKEAEFILGNIEKALSARPEFFKRKTDIKKLLKEIFLEENKIEDPPLVDVIKEDREDNKFLACAWKGKADMVVSQDRHLLQARSFEGIPVFSPREALEKLK